MASLGLRGRADGWMLQWRRVSAIAWVAVLLGSAMTFAGPPRAILSPSVVPASLPPPPSTEPIPLRASWTFLGNRTEGVTGHGFVYDANAGDFILFGGMDEAGGFRDATWSYDASSGEWTNITRAGSPSPRADFGMVYDSHADRIILFGGLSADGGNNETWVFRMTNHQWTQRFPAISPSARSDLAMAYDAGADRTILYGGSVPEDTWAYDYASNTWTQMAPSSSPGVFGGALMTYVPSAGRVVLFGGYTYGRWMIPIWHDRTFAYDYANDTWTDLQPVVHPSGRGGSAMTFDSSAERVLLFGGMENPGLSHLEVNETWAYDYQRDNWTIATPVIGPSARLFAAMAFDPARGRSILVGGSIGGNVGRNDTWAYLYGVAPPAFPRTLLASPAADRITLTWQPPLSDGGSVVTNYTLYRGGMPDSESPLVTLGSVLTYADHAVTLGTRECYRVSAVNAIGAGRPSYEVCATPAGAPSAPLGLVAAAELSRVTLTWQAPLSTGGLDIVGYDVYRGPQGDEFFFAGIGPVLTFKDQAVTSGATYYYRVAAVNDMGMGPMSNEVSATVPTTPSAPLALAASGKDTLVRLTWSPPSSTGGVEVTGYRVYRGEAGRSQALFATLGVVFSFADSAVTNGRTYYYAVSAVNAVGEGAWSHVVSATPIASPDVVLPTIAIASPADGAILGSTVAAVTGVASDNVAVQKVELSADGATWVDATGTTSWSGSLTLREGANTIYARATDTSGNTNQVSASVTVMVPGAPMPSSQEPQVPQSFFFAALATAGALAAVSVFLFRKHRDLRKMLKESEGNRWGGT